MRPKFKVGDKLLLDVSYHAFYQARKINDLPATVIEYVGRRHGIAEYVVSTPNPFREDHLDEQIVEEHRLRKT